MKILLTLEGEESLEGAEDLECLLRRGARGAGRAGTGVPMVSPYAVETDPIEEYGWLGPTAAA